MHRAAALHLAPPVTLQPQYSLLVRDIEHEVVPAALDASIGLLPWSPLGGGWLTGKHKRDVAPTGAHEATASQVAIAWLLAQPAVTSVILGARSVAQLVNNLGASDVDLTADEVARLGSVSAPRVDDYPYGFGGVAQRRRNIEGGR